MQQSPSPAETTVTNRARGTFDVKLTPQSAYAAGDDPLLGRLSLDKQFHGDLEATSKGEMLSAATAVKGSAGYVAIERVSGTLHGRQGTFVFQHIGTLKRGEQHLSVTVVPDSGTADLEGISGSLRIIIEGGGHSYEFDYALE